MKRLLRLLLLWLLLLALPLQGFAAAAMLPCAGKTSTHASTAHNHANTSANTSASCTHTADFGPGKHAADYGHGHHGHNHNHDHDHSSMKCGGSACCAGTAPASAMASVLPALPPGSCAISLATPFPPTVDLAHPERPPQRA